MRSAHQYHERRIAGQRLVLHAHSMIETVVDLTIRGVHASKHGLSLKPILQEEEGAIRTTSLPAQISVACNLQGATRVRQTRTPILRHHSFLVRYLARCNFFGHTAHPCCCISSRPRE